MLVINGAFSFYHASAMAKQLEAQQQQEIMTRIT